MKRLWFAVVFLIISAILCVGEQVYISNVYNEMNAKINAAEAAYESGDYAGYEQETDEIKKLWSQKNDLLFALGGHSILDTIAIQVRSMPYNKGDEIKELHALKAQLYAYYANERITLSNVF